MVRQWSDGRAIVRARVALHGGLRPIPLVELRGLLVFRGDIVPGVYELRAGDAGNLLLAADFVELAIVVVQRQAATDELLIFDYRTLTLELTRPQE